MSGLLCLLGQHRWYLDCALGASVYRCSRPGCRAVDSKAAAARVDASRARVASAPAGSTLAQLYALALDLDDIN